MPKADSEPTRIAKRPTKKPAARPKRVTAKFKRAAMQAYAEFLHMELRLLTDELEPSYRPRYAPVNTAASKFHFPTSDRFAGWQTSPPSSRAIPMMEALGIEVGKHIARDKRLQRKFDRQTAVTSGRAV